MIDPMILRPKLRWKGTDTVNGAHWTASERVYTLDAWGPNDLRPWWVWQLYSSGGRLIAEGKATSMLAAQLAAEREVKRYV